MKRILSFFIVLAFAVSLLASCGTKSFDCAFTFEQIDNTQSIRISWNSENKVEKVNVIVKHGEQTVADKVFEGEDVVDMAVEVDAYYGKHNVTVKAFDSQGVVAEKSEQVALSTEKYIIAPISGSMPQLYFTLYMNEITNNGEIPAFVWLTRPGSWNWDKLPKNVYAVPTVDISEVTTHENYDRMVQVMDAYVEELYSIDNNAKFELYINDYNSYLYLSLMVANGISDANCNVTLLSDGGASYAAFNAMFNSEDPAFDADAKYADMASNLEQLCEETRREGKYLGSDSSVDFGDFKYYCYVAAREKENVEWWVLRPRAGVICSPDEDFINRVLKEDTVARGSEAYETLERKDRVIIERNFAYPLTNMTEEERASLKEFYNFNDEMFADAEKQGKKAMMILGSWATAENEPDFEDYAKLIMEYYGDEFVYYYKGHPNTPTVNSPEKQAQLERLGIIDVESSINAELILFFYPDIYMCGYQSSTFLSVESEDMACAVFNTTSAAAHEVESMSEYVDLVRMFLSKIDLATSEYASLCADETHSYYLVEFAEGEYDFAIFDATSSTFSYHKN